VPPSPVLPLLPKTAAASIDHVIVVMTAIEQALPRSDGLWWFNHLYLRVTLSVRSAMSASPSPASPAFADTAFLERLDVVFANMYFDAVAAGDSNPDAAPPAWRPVLSSRTATQVHPLQFALAGMNAHINRDLPQGIVTVFEQLGGRPQPADSRHDDFERVNGLLEAVEAQIKAEFATGIVATVDALTAPVDDRLAIWSVRAARDTAWTNAEVLWALKPTPPLQQDYFDRLDRFTGFAARGLLAPLAPSQT
jgi:hypothetical protein